MNELEGMDTSPETSIFQYMVNSGFSPEAAAGILGNIYTETGPKQRYQYTAKQDKGGPGRGLFQMEGGKLKAYKNWLDKEERVDSPYAQVDFMKHTIDTGYHIGAGNAATLRDYFNTGDPEAIADAFAKIWERPNPKRNPKYSERSEAAKQTLEKMNLPDDGFSRERSGGRGFAQTVQNFLFPSAQASDMEAYREAMLIQQAEKDTGVRNTLPRRQDGSVDTEAFMKPAVQQVAPEDDELYINKLLKRFWD